MNVLILIPAYNEASTLGTVLLSLKKTGYKKILVIDDGSKDNTAQLAKKAGVLCISHLINRGLGAALGTGFEAAKQLHMDTLVSFDADGQHDPKDIEKLLVPIRKNQADVVIGSRLMFPKGMPIIRRLFNHIANFVTFLLSGYWVSDSQSGLRAFGPRALRSIEIKTNRMEVSSEFILEIKNKNLRLKEVPIGAIYSDYSLSKGQNAFVGAKTFFKLVIYKLMH